MTFSLGPFVSHKGVLPRFYVYPGLILTACILLSCHGDKNLVSAEFGDMMECSEEGLFGNELNCTAFYQCTLDGQYHGSSAPRFKKYDFQCPPGTVFDTKIKNCNHPSESTPVPNCDENANGNGTQLKPTTNRPKPQAQTKEEEAIINKDNDQCLTDENKSGHQATLKTCTEPEQNNQLWIRENVYDEGRYRNKETLKCLFIRGINMAVTMKDCGDKKQAKNSLDYVMGAQGIKNPASACCLEKGETDNVVRCKKCTDGRIQQKWLFGSVGL